MRLWLLTLRLLAGVAAGPDVSSGDAQLVVESRSRPSPAPANMPNVQINAPAPSRSSHGVLAPRNLAEWQLADFLLVSTVDGSLHAKSRETGALLWSLSETPLLTVTQHKAIFANGEDPSGQPDDEIVYERVPHLSGGASWFADPSQDGTLLRFDPDFGLERIPASVKSLVEGSPFGLVDNIMYTGSKKTTMYAINATNGDIVHMFGASLSRGAPPGWVSSDVLLMGRTEYTLEIQEKDSSHWRLTVATWVPNSRDLDLDAQYTHPLDGLHVSALTNSTVLATEGRGLSTKKWISSVSSLAVKTFDVLTPSNRPGRGFAIVSQPLPHRHVGNGDNSAASIGDVYIDKTPAGDLVAVSGPSFDLLMASSAIAPWCTHEGALPNSILGVHPSWCLASQFGSNQRDQLPNTDVEPIKLLPAVSDATSHHLLDPPASTSPPLSIHVGADGSPGSRLLLPSDSWKQFAFRVIENIVTVVLIMLFTYLAAYRGWIPGLADILLLMASMLGASKRGPVSTTVTSPTQASDGSEVTSDTIVSDKLTPSPPSTASTRRQSLSEGGDVDEALELSDREDTGIKKRKRGVRGGKRAREAKVKSEKMLVQPPTATALDKDKNMIGGVLQVTEEVLGYGSHGTTVMRGMFENRAVAVKRMLLSFYDMASQEVTVLSESDDHPNVVRYFCKQETDQFLYIALELCPGTLEDLMRGTLGLLGKLKASLDAKDVLKQITLGLQHLHSLNIVHRDIKPQNILVAQPRHPDSAKPELRLLISDFGLCRRLEMDQSSFQPTASPQGGAAGTAGWAAPEIGRNSPANKERLTRAVDIFSLGCVFYYVLCPGGHPFGDNNMRQFHIEKGEHTLDGLDGPDAELAKDLIANMIKSRPEERPDTVAVLQHPFFWTDREKLDFLVKVSDRLEHDSREEYSPLLARLEASAPQTVGTDWHQRFPKTFVDNLGKYRRYHGDRILDLLRALRNKLHHYNDFSPELQALVGPLPSGYLQFFTSRFPNLLLVVYYYALNEFRHENVFVDFFPPLKPKTKSKSVSNIVAEVEAAANTADNILAKTS